MADEHERHEHERDADRERELAADERAEAEHHEHQAEEHEDRAREHDRDAEEEHHDEHQGERGPELAEPSHSDALDLAGDAIDALEHVATVHAIREASADTARMVETLAEETTEHTEAVADIAEAAPEAIAEAATEETPPALEALDPPQVEDEAHDEARTVVVEEHRHEESTPRRHTRPAFSRRRGHRTR